MLLNTSYGSHATLQLTLVLENTSATRCDDSFLRVACSVWESSSQTCIRGMNDVFVWNISSKPSVISTFRESSFLPSLEKVAHAQTAHRHEAKSEQCGEPRDRQFRHECK